MEAKEGRRRSPSPSPSLYFLRGGEKEGAGAEEEEGKKGECRRAGGCGRKWIPPGGRAGRGGKGGVSGWAMAVVLLKKKPFLLTKGSERENGFNRLLTALRRGVRRNVRGGEGVYMQKGDPRKGAPGALGWAVPGG